MEVTHKHVEAGAHGSEQEKMSRSSERQRAGQRVSNTEHAGGHGSEQEKKARAHGGEKDQELMEAVGRKS